MFKPLGMNDSGFDRPNRIIKNRADGYTKNWGEYYNAYFMDCSIAFAAGGLYSTIEDMEKWDKALYTNHLLSEKYRNDFYQTYSGRELLCQLRLVFRPCCYWEFR
ncbi:MAG: serine hydrolase [Saprospiraceae bacterium]